MNRITKLILLIVICEGVGIAGSIFTISQIPTWYATLNKPFFSPPNFIFGPVWTALYALMGISLFLILEKKLNKEKNTIIFIFFVQLFLNFLWSLIFFGFHSPFYAFIDIVLLWFCIALLIYNFWKFSKQASILLIPYFLWVSFALVLNLSIVLLNK